MPRKKPQKNRPISDVCEVSSSSYSINESTMSANTTMSSIILETTNLFTKAALLDKKQEYLEKVRERGQIAISELDNIYAALRMSLAEEQLQTPVKLEKIADLAAIWNDAVLQIRADQARNDVKTPASVSSSSAKKPRRSRSVHITERLTAIQESPRPPRSSSAEMLTTTPAPPPTFKTPRLPGAAQMMTASKYTVRKPYRVQNPTVPMKRVMRVGEEAISTSGSPLFVQGRVPNEPEVNIPLQNGVIINIDPDNACGPLLMPHLDTAMKKKLKIICEKLETCIRNDN